MKQTKKSEYERIKERPYSEWAEFHQALKGYDIYYDGKKYDKFEVFEFCKNPNMILNGRTRFKAVERCV